MTPLLWFLAGFGACVACCAGVVAGLLFLSHPEPVARDEMDDERIPEQ